ncbi:hypothetical protein FRAAL6828 [Frankia alni ACN14a]|uniref:Uncharacterized protein n=1 Tax=Frankia alni (strain DSM 45986 / CECT 9034 / ACN14a) TaxID=326424 RepID=Q0RAT9_FRAAA|nr:hypothetical protein FRAAL6828 [Frankia alni ACN14a]
MGGQIWGVTPADIDGLDIHPSMRLRIGSLPGAPADALPRLTSASREAVRSTEACERRRLTRPFDQFHR